MKTTILLLFCLATTCLNAQIVNIPDPEFKYILVNYESFFGDVIDTNFDDEIQYSEAAAFTGTLDVGDPWLFNGQIQDLTGIEAFVNLTELICAHNQLTSLDLSQNMALVKLDCSYNNQLMFLDIDQCTQLEELDCSYNQLASLDVGQNIALQYLDCGHNQLTTLNVSQNQNIEILYCYENQLTILDLTHNINLEEFSGFENELNNFDIRNANNTNITIFTTAYNPELSCIFVDNANYCQNSSAWTKDPASAFVETQQECDEFASIDDFRKHQIKIYPNPVKEILNINNNSGYFIDRMELMDIKGKKIHRYDGNEKIDLSQLPVGTYFINLFSQHQKLLTKKIIKL